MPETTPAGFRLHDRHSPLTRPWEPLYARAEEDATLTLAIRVAEAHTNSRGFAHGGVIAALADNAMGLSCAARHNDLNGLVTVSLGVDYYEAARIGQWLAFRTAFVRTGRTLDAAQCFVYADDAVCARANANFRVL